MADLLNLAAESGRNIIGDDPTPTLTLENISSGSTLKLQNAGGTGTQLSGVSCPTTAAHIVSAGAAFDLTGAVAGAIKGSATGVNALEISHTVLAGATIAPLSAVQSTASGAF